MKNIDYEIRERFVKNTNLPIQVLDSPYFEYFLDLYEPTFESKTSWVAFQKELTDSFDGKSGKFFEYFRKTQENIISGILESPKYKEFNDDKELNRVLSETPGDLKSEIYSGRNKGRMFLSVDLKKANFQALHWYNPEIVLGKDTWEDFTGTYTDLQSIVSSKYLRQVIFGKTNPSRVSRVEKYLTWKITELITPLLPESFKLASRMTDESIWEISGEYNTTGELEEMLKKTVKDSLGVEVKVEVYRVDMIQRFTHSGKSILGFIKDFAWPKDKKSELKGAPKMYYPQIYKAWKNLDLNPVYDLVIYHEGDLARFDYPLSIINSQDGK